MLMTKNPIEVCLFCPRCHSLHMCGIGSQPCPGGRDMRLVHRCENAECSFIWQPCEYPVVGSGMIALKSEKDL